MTAATTANLARTMYSRRMKVLAPCLIRAETSSIFRLTVFCFLTHR